MKRILIVLLTICPFYISLAQWVNVGEPGGVSGGWTVWNDIALDSNGFPVIVFKENYNQPSPCLRYDGNKWIQIDSASYNFPVGDGLILNINKNNHIYLFYQDYNSNYPSCIKYDQLKWSYAGSPFLANQIVSHPTIAFDNSGVAYCAFIGSSGFKLYREEVGSWLPISTNGAPAGMAFLSLAFDNQNSPVIAYTDMNSLKANCIRFENNSWTSLGNANFSDNYAQYHKLHITKADDYYIAFDDGFTRCVRLNKGNNQWETIGSVGLNGNYNGITDLISDSKGNIYISTSKIAGDRARCLTFDGTQWVQVGENGISDSTAGYPNIALDKKDVLYATYNDFGLRKAVVKKYDGSLGFHNWNGSNTSFSIYPNPAQDFVFVRFNSEPLEDYSIQIRNMEGRLIYENSISANVSIPVSDLNNGVYVLSIISRHKCYVSKLFKY